MQLQDADQRVRGGGTAWVVGPNMLATNAHVAILREGIRARERMIVRAPGQNGQIYEVVEHKLHPGYVPFNAFLQSDLRLISAYRGSLDSLSGNGYDVALLRVAGTLPEADRLEIATPDELNALASGTPLATSGYPGENLTRSSPGKSRRHAAAAPRRRHVDDRHVPPAGAGGGPPARPARPAGDGRSKRKPDRRAPAEKSWRCSMPATCSW